MSTVELSRCAAWRWDLRSAAEPAERRFDHRLRGDAEMLKDGFIRPAVAEALHADERPVADDRVPSEPHRSLDPDLHLRGADHRAAIVLRLFEEHREARDRHDPGGDSLLLQLRLSGDGERHFGAGSEN